jgi:L-rhamnose mutarotase
MIRKAFLIWAKPGLAAEYKKRHNEIWPEMKIALKLHGISNYSIFLHEKTCQLFGYLEIDNEDLFNSIGEEEVCRRWWKYMTEVLVSESDTIDKANEDILLEVFHLD